MSGLAGRYYEVARAVLFVLAGSAFIGLSAQVAVTLPFTPVPISGQTFAVLLVGAALGSRRGPLAVMTYIAQGLAGLPVFAGGMAGIAILAGPRGGYLLGMVLAAFVVGYLAERGWDRNPLKALAAFAAGNVAVYLIGVPWLALFLGGSLTAAFSLGALPFVVGDAVKLVVAAGGIPVAWGLVGKLRK